MSVFSQGEEKEDLPSAPFGRLMKMNAPEWKYILVGCLAAVINGGIQPSFAVIFGKIVGVGELLLTKCQEKTVFGGKGV
jgi:hypothetical protein